MERPIFHQGGHMPDKPCTVSFVRKFRQHLRNSVEGSRKRFVVGIVGLVAIATGSAIGDIYLPNLFPFLNRTGFSGTHTIISLGGADVGDKTMVDAAIPFRDTLVAAKGKGIGPAWAEAVAAAEEAARGTADFAAKRGRSRTHAEKSIGTPDPGAMSFAKIVAILRVHVSAA